MTFRSAIRFVYGFLAACGIATILYLAFYGLGQWITDKGDKASTYTVRLPEACIRGKNADAKAWEEAQCAKPKK